MRKPYLYLFKFISHYIIFGKCFDLETLGYFIHFELQVDFTRQNHEGQFPHSNQY